MVWYSRMQQHEMYESSFHFIYHQQTALTETAQSDSSSSSSSSSSPSSVPAHCNAARHARIQRRVELAGGFVQSKSLGLIGAALERLIALVRLQRVCGPCKKFLFCFNLFLCLSRACPDKSSVFSIKSRKRRFRTAGFVFCVDVQALRRVREQRVATGNGPATLRNHRLPC